MEWREGCRAVPDERGERRSSYEVFSKLFFPCPLPSFTPRSLHRFLSCRFMLSFKTIFFLVTVSAITEICN